MPATPSFGPDDVVIVGAARTPQGRLKGALATLSGVDLGAAAIAAALARSGVSPDAVDSVYMGQVLQAGAGQCPAKQAAVAAGIPWRAHATTINKVCLSGLSAVIEAAREIRAGDATVAVAGGMESMTHAPHILPGSRSGWSYGNQQMLDHMAHDGLSDAWSHETMGLDTERRSGAYPVTREEQDEIAFLSHQRAAAAQRDGLFEAEMAPVAVTQRKAAITVNADEGIRPDTTAEGLAQLRPAFIGDGTITAGNASQISDGAGALVLTTRAVAAANGWTALATLRAVGQVAGPDRALLQQPANAIAQALARQGWNVSDLDFIEINEAFASVVAWSARTLGVSTDVVNLQGGGIALGHPIGASGARLVVHAAHELARRGGGRAAVGLCGGTGQGEALLLETGEASK